SDDTRSSRGRGTVRSRARQRTDASIFEPGRGGALVEERDAFGLLDLTVRLADVAKARAARRPGAGRQLGRVEADVAGRAVVDVAAGLGLEQLAGRIAVEHRAVPEAAGVALVAVLQDRIAGVHAQQQRAVVGDRAVEAVRTHQGVGRARAQRHADPASVGVEVVTHMAEIAAIGALRGAVVAALVAGPSGPEDRHAAGRVPGVAHAAPRRTLLVFRAVLCPGVAARGPDHVVGHEAGGAR